MMVDMRCTGLILACLVPLACDRPTPDPAPPKRGAAQAEPKEEKRDPVLPTTGIERIQESHDLLAREIAKCEEILQEGGRVERRIASQLLRGVENLITATEIAVRQDAYFGLKNRHARMVSKQAEMRQAWVEAEQEIAHMREILDSAAAGTGTIPEGFTEAEIRDRLGDWQETARKRKEELEAFNKEMAKVEEILQLPPDRIPAASETLFSRELEDLKLLRERAAKVLAKATDPE